MVEAIAKRKSVRSFADRKVEPEKVENLLRAAMRSPSGLNGQPWEFVVVDDKEILSAIYQFGPGSRSLLTAPMIIVVLDKKIPFREEKGLTWLNPQDLAACTQNILLQAVEEGLGAVWMGIGPGTENQRKLGALLGLPENVTAYSMVSVGYPADGVDMEVADRYDATRIHYNHY